jgi:hypothetical protein
MTQPSMALAESCESARIVLAYPDVYVVPAFTLAAARCLRAADAHVMWAYTVPQPDRLPWAGVSRGFLRAGGVGWCWWSWAGRRFWR